MALNLNGELNMIRNLQRLQAIIHRTRHGCPLAPVLLELLSKIFKSKYLMCIFDMKMMSPFRLSPSFVDFHWIVFRLNHVMKIGYQSLFVVKRDKKWHSSWSNWKTWLFMLTMTMNYLDPLITTNSLLKKCLFVIEEILKNFTTSLIPFLPLQPSEGIALKNH